MPAGRPTAGLRHIEALEGSSSSKLRLKAIVATLSGEQRVVDACSALGIGSSRFHRLRHEALEAALARLEPKPRGRRSRKSREETQILAELRSTAAELRAELARVRVQAEVAEILPGGRGRRKRGAASAR